MERDKLDTDGSYHAAKVAWRALAYLQKLIESRNDEKTDTPAPMQPLYGADPTVYQHISNLTPGPVGAHGSLVVRTEVQRPTYSIWGDIRPSSVYGSQQEFSFRDYSPSTESGDGPDNSSSH
jgi:hypothetical protein